MAPADDDRPGGPFQGLPRPAHVRRRAEEADLPPATRSRDAPVEDPRDDDEAVPGPWEPALRRDPRRADGPRGGTVPAPPTAPTPLKGSFPGLAPDPGPHRLPGMLTPAERIEARKLIGIGTEGLAAALGLSARNGERTVRRWEQESPDPEPDDRRTPRAVELLARYAAGVPEVASFLREQESRGAPAKDGPPRSIELLLKMAAEIPEAAAFLREQGRGALAERFRDRGPRRG